MKYHFLPLAFFLIIVLGVGCNDDDASKDQTPNDILSNARLEDFAFNEVDYLDIEITHPVIENGEEVDAGEIKITVPYSQQSLMLSLAEFALDDDRYSISPLAGIQQDFSDGPVTYTITAHTETGNREVRYEVSVVYGGDPFYANALITGFKFEKSKNPALTETIDALKIVKYESSFEGAIYVLVPPGTDFSTLVPTITYDAAKLTYNTDGAFVAYPASNLTVDFRYPKQFHLQAENSLGEKSVVYKVIVDVVEPIQFSADEVVTTNVKKGDGINTTFFPNIITWKNVGNHPITGMAAADYKDRTFPVVGYPENTNIITAILVNQNGGTPGILPGESGQVSVTVKRTPVTGLFTTTVIFKPTFEFPSNRISNWQVGDRTEDLFAPAELLIKSTVED